MNGRMPLACLTCLALSTSLARGETQGATRIPLEMEQSSRHAKDPVDALSVALDLLAQREGVPPPARGRFSPLHEENGAIQGGPGAGLIHPHQIIVRFHDSVTTSTQDLIHAAARTRAPIRSFRLGSHNAAAAGQLAGKPAVESPRIYLVEVAEGGVDAALGVYRSRPEVLYAEPDYVWSIGRPVVGGGSGVVPRTRAPLGAAQRGGLLPDDPLLPLQWGLHNLGQPIVSDPGVAGADIRAAQAWNLWTGNPDYRVAVLDTGINYLHPDLSANVWVNPGEIPGNGVDDDANGWIDDVHGYDFRNDDGDPMDDNGHGSHVAGAIAAAGNNGLGVAGVNWRCKLVALKIFGDEGEAFTSDALEALEYVIANQLPLSNNSWGGDVFSQALQDMIAATQAVDHLFVTAAGNSLGRNIDNFPHFPASLPLDNILSVAATANNDQLSFVSNIGPTAVDLGAPGHNILSTVLGAEYDYLTGTSMATAYATGVAALTRGRLPGLDYLQTRARLLRTARPIDALEGRSVTGGVLNAAGAVGECNGNGIADEVDIAAGTSIDCDLSGIPDECETDCNGNGVADSCDLATVGDCNANGLPDDCDVAQGAADCNGNGQPDGCDLGSGTSPDVNGSGVPDECEACTAPAECDDGNPCTQDTCTALLCAHSAATGACDDGDACTGNDRCELSMCRGDRVISQACAPRFSLKAAAVNGVPLVHGPSPAITAARGDRVTLEMFLERWAPDPIQAYNARLDPASYTSGVTGSMFPVRVPDPDDGAFIDKTRPDYVFYDRTSVELLGNADLDIYQYAAVVLFPDDCAVDEELPVYLGTLIVEVSPTASGSFSICLNTDTDSATFLLDCPDPTQSPLVDFACATVTVPLGGCAGGPDCNGNGQWDVCDINQGLSPDCNRNDIPDECDFDDLTSLDCNLNGVPDECDIADHTSSDCDQNHVPDECEPDCNGNSVTDACDIHALLSRDCNGNAIPDECDIADGTSVDCFGTGNGIPDECEPDCNGNGIADSCDLSLGHSFDADENTVPDECQMTLMVPGDFATIQEAIDGAEPGDTVLLAPGLHAGEGNAELEFGGKILTLACASSVEECVVEISGFRHGMLLASGETQKSRVRGITFSGGLVGIEFDGGSTPLIEDCLFRGQRSASLLSYYSRPRIHGCRILATRAGRSVYCWVGSDMLITNTVVANGRGGMYIYESSPILQDSLITGNNAFTGSSLYIVRGAPRVVGSTLAGNRGMSGTIHVRGGQIVLEDSIVWGNTLLGAPQITLLEQAVLELNYSVLEDGRLGVYVGRDGLLKWGAGNMEVDPRFAGAGGDRLDWSDPVSAFRLAPESPCINAGRPVAIDPERRDVEGEPRVMLGIPDIGADEARRFVDCNRNGIPDGQERARGQALNCPGEASATPTRKPTGRNPR